MENFTAVKNGVSSTRTGFVNAVFSPNGELRPVLFKVYSGYQPDRGTFQGAVEGDLVATCYWDSNNTVYSLSLFRGDTLDFNRSAEVWQFLKKLHPWLDAWLEPSERGEVSLPESVVPESEYLSVKSKKEKLQKFLQRFGLPYQPEKFEKDLKLRLKLQPRPLDVNLDTIVTHSRSWTGSLVSISESEQWFGSNGNGKLAVELEHEPSFEHGSNYAYQETETGEGTPGVKGWRSWKYVVRVCHGACVKDHYSYGHTVDVWQTRR